MTAIDVLNSALKYYDASWAYFHMLHPKTREYMDELLLERQHPLAFQAGTNEQRFRALHAAKFRF